MWEDLNNNQQAVTFSFIPCKNWQLITNRANVYVERVRARQAGTCHDKIVQTNYKFQPHSVHCTGHTANQLPISTCLHVKKIASQVLCSCSSTPGCWPEMLQHSRINLKTSHALGSHWVYLSVQDHLCNILGVIVAVTTK